MKIHVLLFAHYRDVVPGGQVQMELPQGATVAEAATRLGEMHPRLTGLLEKTRVAVAADFAEPHTVLQEGEELAFLPPMSGG